MEDYLIYYFTFNLLGGFAVIMAASHRTAKSSGSMLVSLLFTPICGFLYVLCHPTWEEVDSKKRLDSLSHRQEEKKEE